MDSIFTTDLNITGCSEITISTIQIQKVSGLEEKLKQLEDENKLLKEWISYGKYSAR